MMKRLMTAAAAVVMAACGGGSTQGDTFRAGVPSADAVKMKVPQSKASPLSGEGTRRDGLEGETSEFYKLTRGVSAGVNGATVAVLTLVQKIAEYPPTSVTNNVAVWGPHTEALSPNTFKLTITQTAENQYQYLLEGKAKTEADSAFRVVLSGVHVSTGDKLGNGSFLIDFDKSHQLPENDGNVGTIAITYSRTSATATAQVTAEFHQVNDKDSSQLVDATYDYRENPGQGGSLEFGLNKDMVQGPAIEVLSVRSRWLETGAGRADVKMTGGDLATAATLNECWDANFASRYELTSFDATKNYGADSACAFATAEYAP